MSRKIVGGLVGVLVFGLIGAGSLLAEEEQDWTVMFRAGSRSWLGVRLSDVTSEKARELKLPSDSGAIVTQVEKESPAAKAGLAENDVILEFAGEIVRSAAQLQRLVRETPPGRSVNLQVSRAGQKRSLNLQLEARRDHFGLRRPIPPMPAVPAVPGIEIPDFDFPVFASRGALGISGDDLTRQLADYFGVKQGKGVLVREVKAGSPAEKACLKAGDVIVRVDDTEVGSVGELRRALRRDVVEKRKVALIVVRDRREETLAVELEPAERFSPRRTARLEISGIDPEELKRIVAVIQGQAARTREEAMKAQRTRGEGGQRQVA